MPVREFHQVKQWLFVSLQLLLNSISLNWLTYHRTHKTIRQINHDREAGEREKKRKRAGD